MFRKFLDENVRKCSSVCKIVSFVENIRLKGNLDWRTVFKVRVVIERGMNFVLCIRL